MNSKGPNTDPCGTPPLMFAISERQFCRTTFDFNPQKTKCMLFSTNQGNIKPQILFNNEDVEFVVNHKHLGVTFSSNCKWHCHIGNTYYHINRYIVYINKCFYL
jgi:hypothetical protein